MARIIEPETARWNVDLASATLSHSSGLRVRFVRHGNAWHAAPLAPLPNSIALAALAQWVRTASEIFLEALGASTTMDYFVFNARKNDK